MSKGDYLTPFFPSYLFVNLDVEQDAWRPINSTIGVLQIVKFGIGL
ncbi:MAG: transcription/translation regulatory transformer protein RfaH, partial [Hyphomonas sp.]|nr:transcription/translation regulatory transformer protein RfaH [Hyphomonas sp.]